MATSSGELRMHLQELRVHLQELKAQLQELRAQLQELEVTEVEETGREFGRGSYGVVKELRVRGHRCVCVNYRETCICQPIMISDGGMCICTDSNICQAQGRILKTGGGAPAPRIKKKNTRIQSIH